MKKASRLIRYINKYQSLEGKTYIVTGANSGLGLSATRHFLRLGAHVIMACRNMTKAEVAKSELLTSFPHAKITLLAYDQADFASIKKFVNVIKNQYSSFSGLILNAGIYHPKTGMTTKEGLPLTVGTNYIGVYYLLDELIKTGLFEDGQDRRIIFVGSLSWYQVKLGGKESVIATTRGNATADYCRSKTALGILAYRLSAHIEGDHLYLPSYIKVLTMHPGVSSTNIVGSSASSYPRWFTHLAQFFLNIFTHHPDVASLGIIKLALEEEVDERLIAVPRGLFHITGYPSTKPYPKNLQTNNQALIEATIKVIGERVKIS